MNESVNGRNVQSAMADVEMMVFIGPHSSIEMVIISASQASNGLLINFYLDSRTSASNSVHETASDSKQRVFWLFRISFMCYATIGFIVSLVVGQVVSWLTGGATQQIDENLLIPFFQSDEFKERMNRKPETRYVTIDQMLIEMTKRSKSAHNVDDNKQPINSIIINQN